MGGEKKQRVTRKFMVKNPKAKSKFLIFNFKFLIFNQF